MTVTSERADRILLGAVLLFFAARKHHDSIYSANESLRAFAEELAAHDVVESTIRVSSSEGLSAPFRRACR